MNKKKSTATLLAFFGGFMGLHRFYLGQNGLGILYILFFFITFWVGVLDAIIFATMDQEVFDRKYNQRQYQPAAPAWEDQGQVRSSSRASRYEKRQRERAAREAQTRRAKEAAQYRRRGARGGSPAGAKSPGTRWVSRPTVDSGKEERTAGLRYFKDFEYDRAIIAFGKALEKNPQDVASHFNIAAAYSAEENADRSFYHLDRAMALGFQNTERIRTHDAFAYLRVQPEFEKFAENGFRLVPDMEPEERELNSSLRLDEGATELPPIDEDLLDQLQRLATLKEKGLLTENEFVAQKKRLLG